MLNKLKDKQRRTVGLKQTMNAINAGKAKVVFLAEDVDEYIKHKVEAQCSEHGLKINYIGTMQELGQVCDIDVGAATAAIIE